MEDLTARMETFQRCIEERDAELAADLLDPDYALVLVQPGTAVFPRQQWLASLDGYVVHDYDVHDRVVDVDGDCATILHRATMRATVQGQDRSGVFVVSDVWRRRNGEWRLWRRHSTPLSAGELRLDDQG